MKAWFLPIGLILALVIGLTVPSLGTACYEWRFPADTGLSFIAWSVVAIFLVTGWQMRSSSFEGMGPYAKALAIGIVCNLILGPLCVLALGSMGVFPMVLMVGASVMACMPTTLSSGIVISGQAGGDEGLSIMLTVLLSLVGVLLLPLSVSVLLDVGAEVHVPVWPLIKKLLLIVLLPFAVGSIMRKYWGRPRWAVISYIPILGIILTVWAVASSKQSVFIGASFWHILACVAFGLLVHVLLLLACYVASRVANLSPAYKRSVVIIGSQKTLPIAVAVMVLIEPQINADLMGMGILLCVIWHFSQTLLDSFIAAKWRKSLPNAA